MQKTTLFTIYNASAGSGKTFTLVKEYLKLILQTKKEGYYKYLLAITFTNKAVAEMKQRIIDNLVLFSSPETILTPGEMLSQIAEETNLTIEDLHLQSRKILKHLLHHYAGFNVETIDRFNHQLIRTFARDLKLPQNFEVSLDVPQLIAEAVDQLINKAGEDSEITKLLLEFAIEKTDDDKSWDIAKDITQAAQILLNENDAPHVAKLKEKALKDFSDFKATLIATKKSHVAVIKKTASETLQLIDESGLQFDDFSGSYLPKHFQNLAFENFNINFKAKWQETMGEKPLYPQRVDTGIASVIDELTPVFITSFETTKQKVHQVLFINSILKNITPLSVINLVNQELEIIKEERKLLPISEFNALINNEIKNQPAPFIYERLGEKYRHFFIDEFQDTSLLQWQNLIPLIDNALAQQTLDGEQGSLLLVGDAKQSIYRWRGGFPEQFMSLYGAKNPFSITEKKVLNLETNYRSCKNIIEFNNTFFSFVATHFGNLAHKNLYEIGNRQYSTKKEGGYIKFEFITPNNKAEAHKVYAARVHETILHALQSGFNEKDICILTRTKKEGVSLGAYLMEQGIPIISSETLLLQSSQTVQCIIDTITFQLFPENEAVKINLLDYLYDHFQVKETKHSFFSHFLNSSSEAFEKKLKDYHIDFSFNTLQSVSLYESCEYIVKQFQLNRTPDGYLFGFMDLVFEFQQQPQAGKLSFLDYWETKRENAAILASENTNAVQLMTIHKSKGLEFPVVLFPYADVEIYGERNAKAWFPLENETSGFDEVLINYNNKVAEYGETGAAIYRERRDTLELDAINLLYVTLTRAVEQLYVFACTPKEITNSAPNNFNQLFGAFLKNIGKWNDATLIAEFGTPKRLLKNENTETITQIAPSYITSPPKEHHLKIVSADAILWGTEAQEAIAIGNLLHDTMALIKNIGDVDAVFDEMEGHEAISGEELDLLRKTVDAIVRHPELQHLFKADKETIENEREIITGKGQLLRPDRLNFHTNDRVSIVDYKTGAPRPSHNSQIESYARALEEMNFSISEKILVYVSEEEIMINKV